MLAQLAKALDALDAGGPLSGTRADTAALLALSERLRGLALRELAEMDAVGGHLQPGRASTTASWLRDQQLLGDTTARGAVRLAVGLRDDLPQLGALLRAGGTTVEHAQAVLAGVRGLDRDLVQDTSDGLCELARNTTPTDVRRTLRDKADAVDDRLAANAARRARDREGLRLAEVGGHTAVDGTLAGENGATVRLAMSLAVEADRVDGDTRGTAARQADVLVAWAADYLARVHGPGDSLAGDAHTIRTHLLITCTPQQLEDAAGSPAGQPTFAELLADRSGHPASPAIAGDETCLSRAALRRLACDATLSLAVRNDPALHACEQTPDPGRPCNHLADPLYVGRSARTVSGLQFKALVVRDRTCIVRGCHRPPARCAAHHVKHWADGGVSDLDNLVLLCHQHHHDHHDRGQDLPHRDGRRLTRSGWSNAPP